MFSFLIINYILILVKFFFQYLCQPVKFMYTLQLLFKISWPMLLANNNISDLCHQYKNIILILANKINTIQPLSDND